MGVPCDLESVRAAGGRDVWLLLGPDLDQDWVSAELATVFGQRLAGRSAVVRTNELVAGVRGGQLELRNLDGNAVAAPKVAYARVSTPLLSTDREITLLRHLEGMGTVLLNPIDAVLACVNKFWHLQTLALAGLPVPDTLTYVDAPVDRVLNAAPDTCVVKTVRGHRGRGVFLAPDTVLLRETMGSLDQTVPYLFQTYVSHSHGRDLRVIVIDGHAVTAQMRTAEDGDITANLAQGGSATVCPGVHPAAERVAERAAHALGLAVAGVDLLFEEDGSFTICEVNANVAWKAAMSTVAPAIADACHTRLTDQAPELVFQ